ncbi:hypothetical protein QFZ66_005873 [Streptomyces sp. B4I13]|uniref:hypothetical protein n=1 Tax=Streptomyces sp. B4I13 TaxID=3042271 RepID=UPI002788FA67|nr:hypothetical protein [Streptomyces sp. B4I13]MDQ0961995.1 hypothetical protein [Streptomyces sp. B4I13]
MNTSPTADRPQSINPATLARLWVEDWRAPICSPLRDMIRSSECDSDGTPTLAAFERIAAELNALPPEPATLRRLWGEGKYAPICSPLRDMIRGDECDSDWNPTAAAFERIAAELKALAQAH